MKNEKKYNIEFWLLKRQLNLTKCDKYYEYHIIYLVIIEEFIYYITISD